MQENKEIILIFLGIFLVLGFLWQPLKNAKQNGTGAFSPATSTYYAPFTIAPNEDGTPGTDGSSGQVSESDISSQIKTAEDTTKSLQAQLTQEQELKMRSPYYGKVTMSYVASLNNPDPNQEYISLYANLNSKEKIDITGWKFQSSRSGNWVRIGGATLMPEPHVANNQDVVLHSGDVAYIVKGFSPIGISFRTNKCTGYFEQDTTFYPYLSKTCPLAKDEKDIPQFSSILDRDDECLDIIKNIPACTVPLAHTNINDLPDTVTQSCKDYLQTQINYDTCVVHHKGDTDFPGREWYVYLQLLGPLWRNEREHITLLDNNGLTVSSIDINNY